MKSLFYLALLILYGTESNAITCDGGKIKCIICKGSNAVGSTDWRNCLSPTDRISQQDCRSVSCYTNITYNKNTDSFDIDRGGYNEGDRKSSDKCEEAMGSTNKSCICKLELCNAQPLNITCYSCAFSSTGETVYMKKNKYNSREDCLNINSNTPVVACPVRCMEAYHEISVPNQGMIGLLVRGCDNSTKNTPVEVPGISQYRQCSTSLCNQALPTIPLLYTNNPSSENDNLKSQAQMILTTPSITLIAIFCSYLFALK